MRDIEGLKRSHEQRREFFGGRFIANITEIPWRTRTDIIKVNLKTGSHINSDGGNVPWYLSNGRLVVKYLPVCFGTREHNKFLRSHGYRKIKLIASIAPLSALRHFKLMNRPERSSLWGKRVVIAYGSKLSGF